MIDRPIVGLNPASSGLFHPNEKRVSGDLECRACNIYVEDAI
jgi:hypothetical protein